MFRMLLHKSSYIFLLGVLNFVSGLNLAAVAAHIHEHPLLDGMFILTALNLLLGVNNFAYGLRVAKAQPVQVSEEEAPAPAGLSD